VLSIIRATRDRVISGIWVADPRALPARPDTDVVIITLRALPLFVS